MALVSLLLLATASLAPYGNEESPRKGWSVSGAGRKVELALDARESIEVMAYDEKSAPRYREVRTAFVPRLLLRCDRPDAALFLQAGGRLVREGGATFRTRVDAQPAEAHDVKAGRFQRVGEYGFPETQRVVSDLLRGRELRVELTPEGMHTQQMAFDLDGLRDALGRFERECGMATPFERPAVPDPVTVPSPGVPAAPSGAFGRWTLETPESIMGDRVILLSQTSSTPWKQFGTPGNPALVVRCARRKLEAYFAMERGFALLIGGRARARLGIDGRTQEVFLTASTDKEALFLDDGPAFVRLLAGRSRLTVQLLALSPLSVVPAGEATFELSGLADGLPAMRESCAIN